ncbi:MAG: MFS transporter [Eubacteriales bacterium]|nr:MFS transporter [Eubacteriales bacterium]
MDNVKLSQKNYLAMSAEGSLFATGSSFMDANAVLPLFIFTYTQSLQLTGLATTLNMAVPVIAQLLVGPYLRSIQNVPAYIVRIMLAFRLSPALMAPVLLSNMTAGWKIFIFFLIYILFFFGHGLVVVPWVDLLGRTVQTDIRNRVFGNQQLLGGIGALGAGYIIKILLNNQQLSDDLRYAIIFASSAFVFIFSVAVMTFVRDVPRAKVTPHPNSWHYYVELWRVLMIRQDLQNLILIRIVHAFTTMNAPLLILFGRTLFNLETRDVSTLVFVQIAGSLAGGLIWRTISSKLGNIRAIKASQLIGLLVATLALTALFMNQTPQIRFILYPLVLLSGINMGSWSGYINYLIDISNEQNRVDFMMINNIVLFPLSVLAFISGMVADRAGFAPLLSISLLSALIGLYRSGKLKSPNLHTFS